MLMQVVCIFIAYTCKSNGTSYAEILHVVQTWSKEVVSCHIGTLQSSHAGRLVSFLLYPCHTTDTIIHIIHYYCTSYSSFLCFSSFKTFAAQIVTNCIESTVWALSILYVYLVLFSHLRAVDTNMGKISTTVENCLQYSVCMSGCQWVSIDSIGM